MIDTSSCQSKTAYLRTLPVDLGSYWGTALTCGLPNSTKHVGMTFVSTVMSFLASMRGHLVSCAYLTFILALPSGCFYSQSETDFLGSLPKEHSSLVSFAVVEVRFILTCVDGVRFTPMRAGECQLLSDTTWMFAAPWWHLS